MWSCIGEIIILGLQTKWSLRSMRWLSKLMLCTIDCTCFVNVFHFHPRNWHQTEFVFFGVKNYFFNLKSWQFTFEWRCSVLFNVYHEYCIYWAGNFCGFGDFWNWVGVSFKYKCVFSSLSHQIYRRTRSYTAPGNIWQVLFTQRKMVNATNDLLAVVRGQAWWVNKCLKSTLTIYTSCKHKKKKQKTNNNNKQYNNTNNND